MRLHQPALPTPTASPLASILRPDINVVTVARRLRPEVAAGLVAVAEGKAFERTDELNVSRPDPSALVETIADRAIRDFLFQDIAALVGELGEVLDRRHLHARLAVVRADACKKLHTDYVTVRMLCTYAGPGTEWVPDADVVRENLGRIDVDIDTANRSVLRRLGVIRCCDPGDVILLKGDSFPGNRGRGAVHRSPPIAARGLTRLVLKVDEHPCGC